MSLNKKDAHSTMSLRDLKTTNSKYLKNESKSKQKSEKSRK